MSNTLYIPCIEVSQSYFMMDMSVGTLRFDDSLDKHFLMVGPSATSKSTALATFMKKNSDAFHQVIVPMSSYLTLSNLNREIEKFYMAKRRNILELEDSSKRVVLMIDDIHLQTNIWTEVLDFIRTWCISKGYYDLNKGFFKSVG